MANSTERPNHQGKVFHALGIFAVLMLMQSAGAIEFRVGNTKGWTVPADGNAMTYNQWAEMNRFRTGDSLLFVYQPDKDSVLQVNKDDYDSCNTAKPIAIFNDGNTSFKFNRSGSYHFISSMIDNCNKGEKLAVVVMADRSNRSSHQIIEAPPPPVTTLEPTPPPPTTTLEPTPPPPSTTLEPTPSENTPAIPPVGQESPTPPSPPPSAASSVMITLMGSIGALFVSSFLFVL